MKHVAPQLGMMVMVIAISSIARADEIRLLDQAVVRGEQIRLGEVAQLRGSTAIRLADTVVAQFPRNKSSTTVSLESIRSLLVKRSINPAHVTLNGFASCKVDRFVDPSAQSAPPVANPTREVQLNTSMTLGHVIVRFLQDYTQYRPDELQIRFSPSDKDILSQSAINDRFEIEPNTSSKLGRIPMAIRQWRNAQIVATYRVTAYVARKTLAAATTGSLRRGHVITPNDVEMKQVLLTSDVAEPIVQMRTIIGRESARSLRKGQVIYVTDLLKPVMVFKGDLVTVRCISGGVVVRITARAMDDGSLNDLVMVRNERSREEFAAKVVGQREMIVTLSDQITMAKGAVH